jgi:hypothetical protein
VFTTTSWSTAMRIRSILILALIVACGGGDSGTTGPSSTYADISGKYSGTISATAQSVPLNGTFSITIAQNGGSISGTNAVVGTVNQNIPVYGAGTFTGSVAGGNNPSVNVTTADPECPALHAQYSGSYDVANRRLTMTGPMYITNQDCSIALTYTLTLILTK